MGLRRAVSSIQGLAYWCRAERLKPKIDNEMVERWGQLWLWIDFIHKKCIEERSLRVQYRLSSMKALADFLLSISTERYTGLRKMVSTTPGAIEMIASLWLLETDDLTFAFPRDSEYPRESFSKVLSEYLPVMGSESSPKCVDIIVYSLGGEASGVAQTAIQHIDTDLLHKSSYTPGLSDDIEIFIKFSHYAPIRDALLSQNSVLRTISVIASLTKSGRFTPETSSNISDCFLVCSYYLWQVLNDTNRTTRIIQAIEAQFLPISLKCIVALQGLPQPDGHPLVALLSSILPKYLVNATILFLVKESLDSTDALDDQLERSGPLWSAWLALAAYTQKFLTIWKEKVSPLLSHRTQLCRNDEASLSVPFDPSVKFYIACSAER
jgi:hypothetical protein